MELAASIGYKFYLCFLRVKDWANAALYYVDNSPLPTTHTYTHHHNPTQKNGRHKKLRLRYFKKYLRFLRNGLRLEQKNELGTTETKMFLAN